MAAVINMLLVLLTVGVATVLSQSDVQTRVSKLEQCVGECRAGASFLFIMKRRKFRTVVSVSRSRCNSLLWRIF